MATVNAEIDMETYSEAGYVWDESSNKWRAPHGAKLKGLPVVGVDNYARHPTANILMFAYDLKDGMGWRLWLYGMPFPADLAEHIAAGRVLEAHNAGFERTMWKHVGHKRYGWPEMPLRQWRCSAAKARSYALPGKLSELGKVLNLPIQKDKRGESLMKVFSMPRDPTAKDPRVVIPLQFAPPLPPVPLAGEKAADLKRRAKVHQELMAEHADSLAYAQYCVTDIVTEAEASGRMPDLEGEELEWWLADQAINDRGVHVDRAGLENCAEVVLQCIAKYEAELLALTGIDSANKGAKLMEFLAGQGFHTDSLDEEHVDEALARTDLTPIARRVLEIRSAIGSASVKKVFSMLNRISPDDYMRDLYVFCGAHTGRATSEGPQAANLPGAGPHGHVCNACGTYHAGRDDCPQCGGTDRKPAEWNPVAAEQALGVIAKRNVAEVERYYGSALHAIAGCLRGLYMADDGHEFISSDYNSIEAVGLAMLSGEQWRIDTFRTHGKVYEASAAAAFKVPFEEFMTTRGYTLEQLAQPEWWTLKPANPGGHHKLRKTGKVLELACGYGGWLGSAHAFGMPGTDEEIVEAILAWRAASPSVVWLWGGQTRGKANDIKRQGDRWSKDPYFFGVEGACIQALLDKGTEYHVERMDGTRCGVSYIYVDDVMVCKLPSPDHTIKYHRPRIVTGKRGEMQMSYEGWNTNAKYGPKGWIRRETYGARLVENINQGLCRDILRPAVLRLEATGIYPVCMHTYDEVVSQVRIGVGSHEQFERLVETRPEWALDWPIRAPDSWRGKRYRKA
jgi:DNA polymerase